MNPKLDNIIEESGVYHFTLSNINVSLANALRRIILSEVPTISFNTENNNDNQCIIETNTSRLHNEIIKQRLGCIPIHEKVTIVGGKYSDPLSGKYILEVDVSNDTDNIIFVTTEDFKIKNKENNNYLTQEETHKIFPKNHITQQYIDFVRLRPKISDSVPGEKLKLTCEFSVQTAKENSMYNVVSKCSYSYTPDLVKQKHAWENIESKIDSETPKEEIVFQKKNFELLDSQRYYVENSFDFVIQTVGPYENKEIVKMGCMVLQHKFIDLIKNIDSDTLSITRSETTIDNCYDVSLENEDYTVGKVLEYILYEIYYIKEKRLSFCGFKKFHPHDTFSIIRIAFKENGEKSEVRQCLRKACVDAQEIFTKLYKMF
jgi:DNA-directed RNA polymerase II subunit RPB3